MRIKPTAPAVGFLFLLDRRHSGGVITLVDGRVLVLNQNYEPLHICNWQRAIALLFSEKATALEHGASILHAPNLDMQMPTVVRLHEYVARPQPKMKLSRPALLARDEHRCQYCGCRARDLTVDHVIPRQRGGPHTWENLVMCCRQCNNRKGNRTPREASMRLLHKPRKPRFIPYLSFPTFRAALRSDVWRDYLEPFAPQLLDGTF